MARFAIVRESIFNAQMSNHAKIVMCVLLLHVNKSGKAWPSISTLSRMSGSSESSVRRGIAELEKMGFVKVEKRTNADGGTTSNLFIIAPQLIGGEGVSLIGGGVRVKGGGCQGERGGGSTLTPEQENYLTIQLEHKQNGLKRVSTSKIAKYVKTKTKDMRTINMIYDNIIRGLNGHENYIDEALEFLEWYQKEIE